ncbi:MAG: phosphotransferase [Burkholderiales bacterium]|jgi:aminoglycoside/choline kinase family phosphotransferase|nr:phosphotransferase [Burkholderiales bacterium]
MQDLRFSALCEWIKHDVGGAAFEITPASADASFRRYFRIVLETPLFGQKTLIAMDAPPKKENIESYLSVASLMRESGVTAPRIFARNVPRGFLLLQDFGDVTYQQALENNASAEHLYRDALQALIVWQKASRVGVLPDYDDALLRRELMLFPEWYVTEHRGHILSVREQQMLSTLFDCLIASVQTQPRVFVHRDYHSRNLMLLKENNPGVLDFQDAVYGAITYDLVSLLRDAYIDWDEERQLDWAIRYWEGARAARLPVAPRFDTFWRDFEWMGVQRHLKVAGIFTRLSYRDGKNAYLDNLPRVIHYLRQAAGRYSELAPLLQLLDALDHRQPEVGYTF